MKPRCDCLNFCGDDPYLDKGLVRPCPTFKAEIAARALQDAAPDLLAALKKIVETPAVDYGYDDGERLDAIMNIANKAIRKAEGGK